MLSIDVVKKSEINFYVEFTFNIIIMVFDKIKQKATFCYNYAYIE